MAKSNSVVCLNVYSKQLSDEDQFIWPYVFDILQSIQPLQISALYDAVLFMWKECYVKVFNNLQDALKCAMLNGRQSKSRDSVEEVQHLISVLENK
jgi:hypothetical protein